MTVRERVLLFPTSVQRLWKDWLLYQNIRDAAATPRNAWTVHPQRLSLQGALASGIVHSHIPWRQREQQRRFREGVATVLPVVVLWMIPVVGYLPMLLAVAAPRQVLSRHFHNEYEQRLYNQWGAPTATGAVSDGAGIVRVDRVGRGESVHGPTPGGKQEHGP